MHRLAWLAGLGLLAGAGCQFLAALDEAFYPPQPSVPPWGQRPADRPWIHWGVVTIGVPNQDAEPLRLVEDRLDCERPAAGCYGADQHYLPVIPGASNKVWRVFAPAGPSRLTMRFIGEATGRETVVSLPLEVATGRHCSMRVTLRAGQAEAGRCRDVGRFSISEVS